MCIRDRYLSVPNTRLKSVRLYNIFGQEVWRSTSELRGEITIDIADQTEGVYFLNIQTDKGSINRKIEIMH